MRKLILTFLILSSTLVFSQKSKTYLGLELGPSLKSLYGNVALEDNELSFGYSGGIFFQYNFSKHWAFRTNLSYERKGFTKKFMLIDEHGNILGEGSLHSNFDYLTMPFLLRFTIGENVQYYANAGFYLGYLINHIEKSDVFQDVNEVKFSQYDYYEKLDYGFSSGLGVIIPISEKLSLSSEIRNNLGLANISALPVKGEGSIQTVTTNLLFGIVFYPGNS